MNFSQALAEVISTVKRPDKANLARRKLNSTVSFYCLDNEFKRDYYEQQVVLDPSAYTQAFLISSLTRFRKFHYLKLRGTKIFLKVLPDSELFKDCDNRGRYYIAGDNVNLNLPALAASLDVGYFQYPATMSDVPPNDRHWILDVSPWMVIDQVCSEIFLDIGDEKSWQTHRSSAKDAYLGFRRDQGISTQ